MSILSSISATQQASAANATPLVANNTLSTSAASTASGGSVSFRDVVDALNPLQHIPVISGIYRAATGSSISASSQIAGDTLYGGVFGVGSAIAGLATSAGSVMLRQMTGQDVGQHVLATLGMGSSTSTASSDPATAIANATPLSANSAQQTLANAAAANTASSNSMAASITSALNQIYHTSDMARTTAVYQQTQQMDAINQSLVKMAV